MKTGFNQMDLIADKKAFYRFLMKHMTGDRVRRFEEVLKFRTRFITLAAEDVYQERNASALIRTADCFGVQDVNIIENYNQYKISTSIAGGADKWVDVHLFTGERNNSEQCIISLKEKGYRVVASSPHRTRVTPDMLDLDRPVAIFLGGEKKGISGTISGLADEFMGIPMLGFTESFNLSVAGALILSVLTRRLHDSPVSWQLNEDEKDELRIQWALASIHRSEKLIEKYLAE